MKTDFSSGKGVKRAGLRKCSQKRLLNKQGDFFCINRPVVTRLIMISLFLSLFLGSGRAQSIPEGEWLYCSENEVFFVNERETWEAALFPEVSDDLIVVELRQCRLTLYRNGAVLKRYPVAIGKSSTPSPVGEWRIINKGGSWGGGFGVRWMGINVPWGIYGIHGTNKPNSIGTHSSHGCIRMHNRHVLELYRLVKVGTPVHIIGTLPKVAIRKELKRHSSGEDVVRMQFALRAAGFDQGPADARFGPEMERAVLKLERFYGLPMDGVLAQDEQFLLSVGF